MEEQGILLNDHLVNKLHVGGELAWFIKEFNPSTGYSWKFRPDNSGVYELTDTITLQQATEVPGAPGAIEWKFKAVRPGDGSMMFELFRPGEKPKETFDVKVHVE